jgi:hypothetical protein
MFPRWHILLGLVFSLMFWAIFPQTHWIYISVMFLSTFLIDFDHYMNAVLKTRRLGLFSAFEYYKILIKRGHAERKKGIFKKGDFHIFHTIEFHALVLLAGFVHPVFFYVFAGMAFHSLVDLISLAYDGTLYKREYFFVRWLIREMKNK